MKNRDENFCLGTSAFDEGLGSSPSKLRSIGETMAEVDKARAAMIENRMHRLTVAGMGAVGTYDSSLSGGWDLAKRNGGWSAAISERMRPFGGTARIPLHPSPRPLKEKVATNLRERASAVKNKRWELMFKPRGNLGAASPPFARVPDYNNELLLLL